MFVDMQVWNLKYSISTLCNFSVAHIINENDVHNVLHQKFVHLRVITRKNMLGEFIGF